MKKTILILILVLVLLATDAKAEKQYQIGVSPRVIELGDVEPGTSHVISFYIITEATNDILVNLEKEFINMDFFDIPKYSGLLYNYSEQDTYDWIEFIQNPVLLKYSPVETEIGSRSWRKVNFILNVPEDAESGYHLVRVKPKPTVPTEYATGARIVTIATVTALFRVPGEAIRSGKILDVVNGKSHGGGFDLNTFFQNNGTTTISVKAVDVGIVDDAESKVQGLNSPVHFVGPGSLISLDAFVSYADLDDGEYEAYSNVSYSTGQDSKVTKMYIQRPSGVEIKQEEPEPAEDISYLNYLIIILIVVIAIVIYRKGSS